MNEPIERFVGRYEFLSNFYRASVVYENELYPTAEHAFQAAKTLVPLQRKIIRAAILPRDAKRIGRQVDLRPFWSKIRDDVMYDILCSKFQHELLAKKLLETERCLLMEGNTWGDTYWGCIRQDGKWVGKNQLGKLLMKVRHELRKG